MSWFKKRTVKDAPKSKDAPINTRLEGNVYDTDIDGETKFYHSFVGKDLILKHGLKGSVISGKFEKPDDGGSYDNFIANSQFKKTVFHFVHTIMRQDPNLIKAAENQIEGYVYVIDKRVADPNGRVELFDILGSFKVENKRLGTFEGNANYQIKSVNGFINFGSVNNAKFNKYLEDLLISGSSD